jgi:GST-like protein
MIDLYYWPTPNGHKITMFLEEAGLDYTIHPVDISAGDQFKPDFLAISPNNRMPAIIDTAPADGGEPISVFESGAILLYLAEKTGRFLPKDVRGRKTATEWLFWQVGGLGPMAGQNHHFGLYAPTRIPYAVDRYVKETNRLYGVLDRHLENRTFIAGDGYSIADMASYPWIVPWKRQQQNLDDFPNLQRWFETVRQRPGTQRAYARGEPYSNRPTVTEEGKKILFGQTASRRLPDGRAAESFQTSHCMVEEKMTDKSSSQQQQAPERRSIDQSKIAYQKPQPAGMVSDVFVGSAPDLDGDEREWVPQSDTVAFRPLVLNVSQGYYINILRVRSSGVLSRHRHSGPVHAFTLRGRWRYLEHDWVASPGDYAFEPPGETHTLVVPDDVKEMATLFHVTGGYTYVDPYGEALGYEDVFTKLEHAIRHYEAVGLGKDHVRRIVR